MEASGPSPFRESAKGLGLILLAIAGLFGGMVALIIANDSVMGPIAESRSAFIVIVVGAILTAAAAGLAAKATIEPPAARYAVIVFAVCCGVFTYSTLTGWESAKELVSDYCSYGAVSEAQLDGCKSRVVAADIVDRDTPAARFANGSLDDVCGPTSGPFCQAVWDKRWTVEMSDP